MHEDLLQPELHYRCSLLCDDTESAVELPSHSRASPSLALSSSHPSRRAPLRSAACMIQNTWTRCARAIRANSPSPRASIGIQRSGKWYAPRTGESWLPLFEALRTRRRHDDAEPAEHPKSSLAFSVYCSSVNSPEACSLGLPLIAGDLRPTLRSASRTRCSA